jgi:hypothetical protein
LRSSSSEEEEERGQPASEKKDTKEIMESKATSQPRVY